MAAILKNRYDIITSPLIVRLRRNANWLADDISRSNSKPEIQFQYGGRPFSETVGSFVSTVDRDISSKVGMQIDFHHFERMQSLNLNSEVDFRLYDCHLKKSIWRQNSANVRMITMKFPRRMQNDMWIGQIKNERKIAIWRPSIIRNRK